MSEAKLVQIHWFRAIFLVVYQLLLLSSLPFYFYYFTPKLSVVVSTIVLLYATGLSITMGYHRLYSHRTYRVHPSIEWILLFFGTMALEGSALRWSYDHRMHHARVDTDDDPYSIKRGFWHAHFFWLFEKRPAIEPKVVPDLMKNPLVMFQDKYYDGLAISTNLTAFVVLGFILGDFLGSFILITWTRIFLLHHFTWFINSLAHWWGEKPFNKELSAVDNYFIALLTFGEGYHNYHHTFANDYRNGICWFHFDPSKWLIWSLHKMGLAYGLKQVDPYTIKRKMVIEDRNELMDQIKEYWHAKKEELEREVNEISEQLIKKINDFGQLKERYAQLKKEQVEPIMIKEFRGQIRELSRSLKADWAEWTKLCDQIMNQSNQVEVNAT